MILALLQGISLVRRNSEWHHFDPLGTAQVITNGSAQVVSNNVYDVFGVLRYEQGSAQTPWRWRLIQRGDDGLSAATRGDLYVPERMLVPFAIGSYPSLKDCPFLHGGPYPRSMCQSFHRWCLGDPKQGIPGETDRVYQECQNRKAVHCLGGGLICAFLPWLGKIVCIPWMVVCNLDDMCDRRRSAMVRFCLTCYDICMSNSVPDKQPAEAWIW